jgi:5-hydroxyisourate hydrolase
VEIADLDLERRHGRRITVADGAGPTISTHVLDTEHGVPAAGIRVALWRLDVGAAPIRMTQALTDADGRIGDLLERPLVVGDYRLEFDVGREDDAFFRRVAVDVRVADATRSYHVPILLAPFAMTAYRGS